MPRSLLCQTLAFNALIGICPVVALAQSYTFPVPVEFARRVDVSSAAFPWVFMGAGTQLVARSAQTAGCAGTYPNGAPARVNCSNPTDIIGPQYVCSPVQRTTHVGEIAVGFVRVATTPAGLSDGHNPDACVEPYVGSTEARTRFDRFSLAGARWACPSGVLPFDVDGDGSTFGAEEFPYRFNPEACGVQYCPEGSALAYLPGDPQASHYLSVPGYVCSGFNEQKQPCDCEDKSPQAGDPVVIATGNSVQLEVDFSSTKPAGLAVRRHYSTRGRTRYPGAISSGWFHEYEVRILGSAPRLDYVNSKVRNIPVLVMRESGEVRLFTSPGVSVLQDGQRQVQWIAEKDNQTERLVQLLDAQAHHAGWLYFTRRDAIERYDTQGRLLQITTLQGHSTTLDYALGADEGGDADAATLDRVIDHTGASILFRHDSQGRLAGFTDPDGHVYHYEYDAAGNLGKVTYPDSTPDSALDNPVRLYHYEDARYSDFMTGITDETGVRHVTWTFDGSRRVVSTELAGGVGRFDWVHGPAVVTMTEPLGLRTQFTFANHFGVKSLQTRSRLATSRIPMASQLIGYDEAGNVSRKSDWNGQLTLRVRDGLGREVSRTEAAGTPEERTITTDWHPTLRLPSLITEPGRTTAMTYDSHGNLLTRTETDTANSKARTWTYTYFPRGENGAFQLATMDGPRTDVSDVTRYTYSVAGLMASITNPAGHVTRVTRHNARGLPLELIDANGVVTQMTYHPRGWLLTSTVLDPGPGGDQAVTRYEYDKAGQMSKVSLPNGAFLTYEYDAAHRLTAIGNNLNERQEYTLDAAGNITQEVLRNSAGTITRTQQSVFDELSRIQQAIGGAGQVTHFDYDNNGNQTLIAVDPAGLNQRTLQAFDALNRLHTSTDALHNQSRFLHDARDNLIEVADQRGLKTVYTFDGLNNLVELHSPDTGITRYTHDAAGNLLGQTDARGVLAQYSYDALNRLTAVTYPDSPGENIAYFYDQADAEYGVGRLTRVNDQSGSTSYVYDHRGNQLQSRVTIQGNAYTTAYAYDIADNLVQTTYPSGRVVNHLRDSLGRTAEVSTAQNAGTAVQPVATDIRYLPFGPLQSLRYGNLLELQAGIDADYRISTLTVGSAGVSGTKVLALGYTQNAADNITAITDALSVNRSQAFTYDPLNRLLAADGAYGIEAYTYDPVGNRLSLSATKQATTSRQTYTYDSASNRLLSVDLDGALRTLEYDSAGNLISDDRGTQTGFHLEYNAQNRLIEAMPQLGPQPQSPQPGAQP